MPSVLKKRCAFRGCPKTTRQRYCDEHLPLARKVWDRSRGTTTERGYDGAWKQVAEQRRQLDCGLCQHCLPTGRVVPSQLVDHILPIHVRPDWRLEIGNTQVLCFDCHTVKTSEDMQRYGGRVKKNLTSDQILNRYAAQQMARPPREGEAR
jgi:5-methylcytosine-specific restriction protein A